MNLTIHSLDISWLTMEVTKETTGHPHSKHQAWSSSASPHLIAKPDIGGIFGMNSRSEYGAMNGAPRKVDPQRRQKSQQKSEAFEFSCDLPRKNKFLRIGQWNLLWPMVQF